MRSKSLAFLVTTSLLTGCGSNTLRPASTTRVPEAALEREATAVHLRPGLCAEPPAPLTGGSVIAAAAIGVVADFAVSALTAALRRQRDGRNAAWVASGHFTRFGPTSQAQDFCLTVARGTLLPGGVGELNFRDRPVFLMTIDLTVEGLPVAPPPAPGAGAAETPPLSVGLIARPYELHYADTSAPVRGSGRKNVSVIIALSPQTLQPASGAAAVPDTAKASVLRLDLGRLEVGRTYDRSLFNTISAVTPLTTTTEHGMITAVVTESEDSTIALDALISAVESNSDDLSAALKATIEDAVGVSDDEE